MPAFDQLRLHTPRLLLRPLQAADAPALFAVFSDPAVMRHWSTPPWPSLDCAHALISADLKALPAGEHLRLGIERVGSAGLIGTCSLFALSATSRRAELGFALALRHQGQAYMDEALRALLRWGFAAEDGGPALNRVEADIDPRNEASARSLERLGFQREGLLRERWIVGGQVSDSALYGLLLRDWQWRQ